MGRARGRCLLARRCRRRRSRHLVHPAAIGFNPFSRPKPGTEGRAVPGPRRPEGFRDTGSCHRAQGRSPSAQPASSPGCPGRAPRPRRQPRRPFTADQRALRTTRRLGGYVVTVNYGTPEPTEGTATLRVRIPVSRVQSAIVQFSGLGRILGAADSDHRSPAAARRAHPTDPPDEGQGARQALRRQRIQLNRRAAYATVDLALTTHEPEPKAATPSRFDRAVDDAAGVLTTELAIAAYVLIVASPFLLLLAAAFAGSRAYRRYADQRLLERVAVSDRGPDVDTAPPAAPSPRRSTRPRWRRPRPPGGRASSRRRSAR